MGDAAVRRFGVDREDLEAELARAARRHGVDAARRVVRFLSGHSESVGESRSRVMLSRAGLPLPSQQGEVFEPGGAGSGGSTSTSTASCSGSSTDASSTAGC